MQQLKRFFLFALAVDRLRLRRQVLLAPLERIGVPVLGDLFAVGMSLAPN
jgi:hypothetical protein